MCYKYHSLTFRKSQLQEKKKCGATPDWNRDGGHWGGEMISAAMMLNGCLAYHIIGIHKQWRQYIEMAFWLRTQKPKVCYNEQSPRALAHMHAQKNEPKKNKKFFPVKSLQISVWSVS